MSNDVVIRAEGLGKKYLIGHESAAQERYTALRDVIMRTAKGLARTGRDMLRGAPIVAGADIEEFWALRDVSFEIKRGEVVGIIGRNGAGKSTLLKILSRITEPTAGRVEIKGRVASLLEVGTGFHPELTGRENIYLNGAILGMSRAEIRRKFDEIVAFAEVEKFLDTPVKRYSSGMYVRLAFAVAAHLEPEILVVDEVLAVGDAEFQKKCLGKMKDVAGHGRTVLFVSHNMAAIASLCSHAVVLSQGQLHYAGSTTNSLNEYNRLITTTARRSLDAGTSKPWRIESVDVAVRYEDPPCLAVDLTIAAETGASIAIEAIVHDRNGVPIAWFEHGTLEQSEEVSVTEGLNSIHLSLNLRALAIGTYTLTVQIMDPGIKTLDRLDQIISFDYHRSGGRLAFESTWGNGCIHFKIDACVQKAQQNVRWVNEQISDL